MNAFKANSANLDRMPHFVASDLGKHCLSVILLAVPRLKRITPKKTDGKKGDNE